MRVLMTWIGVSDLVAARKDQPDFDPGPVFRLLRRDRRFDAIHLLNDIPPDAEEGSRAETPRGYCRWLADLLDLPPEAIVRHDSPQRLSNHYQKTYEFTHRLLSDIRALYPADAGFALLLSPGYPAGQVAMILAAQTLFGPETELFNTWQPRQADQPDWERVELSFALSVDAGLPRLLRRWQRFLAGRDDLAAFAGIRGESAAIRSAKVIAARAAAFDGVSVLLRGESGTGKDLFARGIHQASRRREGPFIPINCAAIPRELLESELFGHVRGSFTGAVRDHPGRIAEAQGGTLFLDEIGDMSPDLQAKLLRFLEDRTLTPVGGSKMKTADVRILAATHRDLDEGIRAGRFRADLYYRLDQVSIHLPSLRQRGGDIRLLATGFLDAFNRDHQGVVAERLAFSEGALLLLARLPWPGNVRELKNAVVRLAVLAEGPEISERDVETWLGPDREQQLLPLARLSDSDLLTHLAAVCDELLARKGEDRLAFSGLRGDLFEELLAPLVIGRALHAADDNRTRAGELLRGNKLDLSEGKADRRHAERYRDRLADWLDGQRLRLLRGTPG